MAPQPRPPRRGDVPKVRKESLRGLYRNIVPRFFISLINGMISDCGSKVEHLTEGLAESREVLKGIEATLKSTEDARPLRLRSWRFRSAVSSGISESRRVQYLG
ncbi:BnaC07g14940D [Brassica napus]|uniref:BnaC07g14940D protein n=1 Tax=Brassica napus TaxID=3708 RepID=A0A078HZY0_BRANA|nr:BnaC07g14940D [Brassica napus]